MAEESVSLTTKLMIIVCMCYCMCSCISSSVGVFRNCTGGSFDVYDYDSQLCLAFPSLGPGPAPAADDEEEENKFPDDIPGLTGRYTVDSVKMSAWYDKSGKVNDATVVGTLAVYEEGDIKLVRGDSAVTVNFPAACLGATTRDYTLAYVGKYAGDKRGRIFDGVGVNWLSGWHGNRSGYAYHGAGDWLTVYDANDSKHGQALIMGVDQKNLFRVNGVDKTKVGYTNGEAPTSISINNGLAKQGNWGGDGEVSDFALGEVLIYNRELSENEIERVETYLKTKFFKDIETEPDFIAKGWRQGEPAGKNGEGFEPMKAVYELSGNQEHCRMLAEKHNKAVWGHRNDKHPQPEWRNTCWFYDTTENFDGYVDDTADEIHTMGCADASKDVHNGCQ